MKEKPIAYPTRWSGIKQKTAVFVPFDLPSRVLRKALLAGKPREMTLPYAKAYLTPDQVVIYGAVGAPLTAICMEELIVSGVREFLVLGVCGSLNEEYRIGAAVCVTKALSEDGTTRMYHSKKRTFLPSPELNRKIHSGLTVRGLAYQPGVVVTIDAPYRETPAWLRRNQKRGAGLVDMEAAAVFAVAEHYGLRAAALLVVSDEIFTGTWQNGLSDPALEKGLADHLAPFL